MGISPHVSFPSPLTFVSQPLLPPPAEEEDGHDGDHDDDDGAAQGQHDVHLLVELHLLLVHHVDRLDGACTGTKG